MSGPRTSAHVFEALKWRTIPTLNTGKAEDRTTLLPMKYTNVTFFFFYNFNATVSFNYPVFIQISTFFTGTDYLTS